jgi:SSS family solute:Na+ symporter
VSAHLVLLLAYSVLLIGVGIFLGRSVRSTSTFFVADRRLGGGLLFSTLLAANIGAGSTVGATGLGYRDGLAAWWWVGSAGLGSLLLAFWVGPRIWRVATQNGLFTVGDFLELRYGRAVRGTVAALLWVATLTILASQLIAMSWVLQVVAGLPKYAGCLIGGAVMTTYFTMGGLLSSAWVNLVQLVVLLFGFAVALPLSLSAAGGWTAVSGAVTGTHWSFWQAGSSGWIYLALLGPAFVISPGLLQKVYGGRDESAVRRGVAANAGALLLFAFFPALLGIIARAQHPALANHELALPTLLTHDLPLAIGGLGLAAIFSAEVSSADAILFMLATSLSQDLYRRFIRPAASEARVLAVARGAAVIGGILGVALSLLIPTVIKGLEIFYALLGVSLFVPVVAGLHTRKSGAPEAFAAIGAGVATLLAVQLATRGAGFGPFTPNLLGLLASAVGFGLVALGRARKVVMSGEGKTHAR